MAEPPVSAGAVQLTVAWVLPAAATTFTGGAGTVAGVAPAEVTAGPVPRALVAVTSKVYSVPLVRPVKVQDSGSESTPTRVSQTSPSGDAVTV